MKERYQSFMSYEKNRVPNIYCLKINIFQMGSIIVKAVAHPLHSVLHNPSQNIWSYFVDFLRDFLFELKKSVWLIGRNLRFQASLQKKRGRKIWRGHQIQRLNGREMPSRHCHSWLSLCTEWRRLDAKRTFSCLTFQEVAITF